MNLWIFNHYAHPPDLPGGTRHYDLGRELVRRGHRVTIIASSFSHSLHRETRLRAGERWRDEIVDGVRFVWIRTHPYRRNDWRRVLNMASYALRAGWLGRRLPGVLSEVGKPDAVIGSSVHLLAVLAAYWVARRHRAGFVMEVRDLWPLTLVGVGGFANRHPIIVGLRVLERFLYRRAQRIIILGSQMREYVSARGIYGEKTVWIPNGVDLSRFEDVGQALPSDGGQTRVAYVGTHGQANSLDVFLGAARIVQDERNQEIRFALVGDGPEKPRLKGLAQSLELRNVEFCDPVPKLAVPEVLREADVLVATVEPAFSAYGGSLNKLFDYMAAGKPIVLGGSPAHNEIDLAGCGITVPPRDPQALAEAIVKLSRMPSEELAAMGRRGRAYVEEHHDIVKLAERLEDVLIEVVGNRGP